MNDLQKKMSLLGTVRCICQYPFFSEFQQALGSGEAELLTVEHDSQSYLQVPIKDRLISKTSSIWTTYEGCREVSLELREGKLVAQFKLYEGNFSDGSRKGLRFSIVASIPMRFLEKARDAIECRWEDKLEREFEEFEEQKKRDWMESRSRELLK